jgi:hypothetical protein
VVPSGGAGAGELVTRGGAWCDGPPDCRLVARRVYRDEEASIRVGFRLARDAKLSSSGG